MHTRNRGSGSFACAPTSWGFSRSKSEKSIEVESKRFRVTSNAASHDSCDALSSDGKFVIEQRRGVEVGNGHRVACLRQHAAWDRR